VVAQRSEETEEGPQIAPMTHSKDILTELTGFTEEADIQKN
jgi:hypothetical protein